MGRRYGNYSRKHISMLAIKSSPTDVDWISNWKGADYILITDYPTGEVVKNESQDSS